MSRIFSAFSQLSALVKQIVKWNFINYSQWRILSFSELLFPIILLFDSSSLLGMVSENLVSGVEKVFYTFRSQYFGFPKIHNMKTRSKFSIGPHKLPSENNFISSITNYQDSYRIINPRDRPTKNNCFHGHSSQSLVARKSSYTISNFLQAYFETVWILFTSPFRIGKNKRGRFIIKKNRFQMVRPRNTIKAVIKL